MGDMVHTSEWTYEGVECACITVSMAEQSRYIGYISIGNNSIEVMDTTSLGNESDAMDHIEQKVDSVIDYASGLSGDSSRDPIQIPDIDPSPNDNPSPFTDPDLDEYPWGPHFMSWGMDDDNLSTIEEIMGKHRP